MKSKIGIILLALASLFMIGCGDKNEESKTEVSFWDHPIDNTLEYFKSDDASAEEVEVVVAEVEEPKARNARPGGWKRMGIWVFGEDRDPTAVALQDAWSAFEDARDDYVDENPDKSFYEINSVFPLPDTEPLEVVALE